MITTFDGYKKRDGNNSNVLLDGGETKPKWLLDNRVIVSDTSETGDKLSSSTGSFTFLGNNLINNLYDWVGLLVSSSADRGLLVWDDGTLRVRLNDNANASGNWTDWATLLSDKNWNSYVDLTNLNYQPKGDYFKYYALNSSSITDFNFADGHDVPGGIYYLNNTSLVGALTNKPNTYGLLLNFEAQAGHLQLASSDTLNVLKFRSYWWTNNSLSYSDWVTILHSGNSSVSGKVITINGNSVTVPDNTHYTTGLYVGETETKSNKLTTNGNTYIKLFDDSTRRSNIKISGTTNVSVSSDSSGNITITGPNLSGYLTSHLSLANYYTKTQSDERYIPFRSGSFSLHNNGNWMKILQFKVPYNSLESSISFTWYPTECARTIWADFNINLRYNSSILGNNKFDTNFFVNWNGTDTRTLKCVYAGTTNNISTILVWVQCSKANYDPYGMLQIRNYSNDVTNITCGSLEYTDTEPTGTYPTVGGYVDWTRVLNKPNVITSHLSLANYVKLDPGAAEQTIKSSIGSMSKGVINLWRSSGNHYTFLGFSNGTTETYLGGIGFTAQGNNCPYYLNTSGNAYPLYHSENLPTRTFRAGYTGNNKVGWWCPFATIEFKNQYKSQSATLCFLKDYTNDVNSNHRGGFLFINVQQLAALGNAPNISLYTIGLNPEFVKAITTLSSTSNKIDFYIKLDKMYQYYYVSKINGDDIINIRDLILTLPSGTQYDCKSTIKADTGISLSYGSDGTMTIGSLHVLKTGDTMTGDLILKGTTSADMTYSGNVHPALKFANSDSSQIASFIYTDYDSYRYPFGIRLVGYLNGEKEPWFEAPYIISNRCEYGSLSSGTQLTLFATICKNAGGTAYDINTIIATFGSGETNSTYNLPIRFGSASGTTWISAGESANTFSSVITSYNNTEDLLFTADGNMYVYTLVSNDSTSKVLALSITGSLGNASFNNNITAGGNVYASSDIRLKDILSEVTYSAEQFAELPIVKYNWKKVKDKTHVGSIALDAEKNFPELVNTDEYKSLDYATLGTIGVISLAREIVELKKEIKELKKMLYE